MWSRDVELITFECYILTETPLFTCAWGSGWSPDSSSHLQRVNLPAALVGECRLLAVLAEGELVTDLSVLLHILTRPFLLSPTLHCSLSKH